MKRHIYVILFTLISFVFCSNIMATPVNLLDLSHDSGFADVICTAKMQSYEFGSKDASKMVSISIVYIVDRVIKGDINPGDQLTIGTKQQGLYGRHIVSGYDLLLLKRDGARYIFALDSLSTMPVAEEVHLSYSKSSDTHANLRWEIINSLQDLSFQIVREALRQVTILSANDVVRYVRPLISNPDISIHAYALAACVKAGDQQMFSTALDFIFRQYEEKPNNYTESGFGMLRSELMSAKIPPDQISAIGDRIKSTSIIVRQLASYLLMKSESLDAASYLKSSLDDTDFEVRHQAVMGLAFALHDYEHCPSIAKFKANESEYLNYWKNKDIKDIAK